MTIIPRLQIKGWGDMWPRLYYDRGADHGYKWCLLGCLWQGDGLTFTKAVKQWLCSARVGVRGYWKHTRTISPQG